MCPPSLHGDIGMKATSCTGVLPRQVDFTMCYRIEMGQGGITAGGSDNHDTQGYRLKRGSQYLIFEQYAIPLSAVIVAVGSNFS